MPAQLDRQLLIDRLKDATRLNYLSLASIIAGVNLAVAADSLVRFLAAPTFPWDKFPLWLCGFESIVIAYSALTLVPIVVIYSPSWRDHLLPLIMGLSVLLLFELVPNPALGPLWYFFAALTCASRVGLSHYVASRLRWLDSEEDIKDVIQDFGRSMSRVYHSNLGTCAYFLLAGVGLLLIPGLGPWQWVLGVLGVLAQLGVILLFEKTRARLVSSLD